MSLWWVGHAWFHFLRRCKWARTHRNGVPVGIVAAGTTFLFGINLLPKRCPAKWTKHRVSVPDSQWLQSFMQHFPVNKYCDESSQNVLEKLPSIDVGPTALAWPMTLTLNTLRAKVLSYSHAKVPGQRSVGFEDRLKTRTDRRTDGRMSALTPTLIRSLMNQKCYVG